MPHDDAQAGIVPLRLERFLNAAVRAFEIRPVFKNVVLKAVHRPAVETGSAGETFVRGVRGCQVFGYLGFYARFHGHPV